VDDLGKKSVKVRLRGGLGNQLFGWAAGYSLAQQLDARLVLLGDQITRNDPDLLDPRMFELDYFGMEESKERLAINLLGFGQERTFRENRFAYDSSIERVNAPVTLDGYFQSWKYFHLHQQEIRALLRGRILHGTQGVPSLDRLSGLRWVGVHVRRGDYLRVTTMALPGADYYDKAIELVAGLVGAQRIVVYTDDVEKAKEIVPAADEYIGPLDLHKPGDVLRSLSHCDGFVAANSSLSWWASFMNKNPGAPRVFPQKWFTDPSVDTKDLLPLDWATLPSDN
jgi:voltage-gated potassium channel Kch